MKELDPFVIAAVLQEMLGAFFWPALAVTLIGTLAFVALLVRERRLAPCRLRRSLLAGILGGILALVLVIEASSSSISDGAALVDWIVMALIFTLGLVCAAVLAYTVAGWWPGPMVAPATKK